MTKLSYSQGINNFGDILSPIIVKHFWGDIKIVDYNQPGKLLAIGSILQWMLRENDTVWGSGIIQDMKVVSPPNVKYLAVRGPLTRERIIGGNVPEIYGDPALLLPKIYYPKIEKKYKVGLIPHFADKRNWQIENAFHINILDDWEKIVEQILSCETIIASAMHGIIVSEAYGIPTAWYQPATGIMGGEFKFQDYFLSTDREKQIPSSVGDIKMLPPIDVKRIQEDLISVI